MVSRTQARGTNMKRNRNGLSWLLQVDRHSSLCPYIDLYLIHGPCPIGELEGNLLLPEEIGRSTQKYCTSDVSHMEEQLGSGLPLLVIHQVCMTRHPKMHAIVTDKFIRPAGLICIPSWSVLKLWCPQKSTSYHWKYVHVVQTKFYTCYLLKAWAALVRGLRFNYRQLFILNHRYNKTPAKVLLRYSLQKVQLLVFSWSTNSHDFCFQGFVTFPNLPQSRELPDFCVPAFRRKIAWST